MARSAARGTVHARAGPRTRCPRTAAGRPSSARTASVQLALRDDFGQLRDVDRMSSVARYLSSCGPVVQVSAGSLAATPRGSKPTMSNRASTAAGNSLRAPSAYWTPEPPGPPG